MLHVEGLHARYTDTPVLRDVTVRVGADEIVAVLGANAAGKSTLLRAISGVLVRTTGTMTFEGDDLTRVPAHRRAGLGLVHVPEGRHLFAHMTVRENLEMGAFPPGARAGTAENLERVFGLFPVLRERSTQLAGQLSGGEQQMCAFARALMCRPRLLMVDEPTLGLAPLVVEQVFELIEWFRESGIAVLLVEQNAVRSLRIADRAYVLERGRVVLSGTPQEMLAAKDELRRAYIGR
jgi:branched-chain amino acid transport system ATP-binding protein